MTKEEALKVAKKLLDRNIDEGCFGLAGNMLDIIKTIRYGVPCIDKENVIRADVVFDREYFDKLIEYLKENNLWEER